ncbi:MAG: hypothetical protein RLZZ579_433 [Actinomycetota bacterium]
MEILKFSEPPKRSNRSGSAKRSGLMPMVTFGIAVLVLGGMSTTLAGTISLNSGNNVEFGQGVVTTAACDTSISIAPTSSYDTATGFYVSEIAVYDIGVAASDTTTSSGRASGCLGKTFKLTAVGETSTINMVADGQSNASLSFTIPSSIDSATSVSPSYWTTNNSSNNSMTGFTLTPSNAWTATNGVNGTTNSGKITIGGLRLPATVLKITLESS